MSEPEKNKVVEMSMEELDKVVGGAFKPLEKTGTAMYQVQPDETLMSVAAKLGCTVKDLLKWNPQLTRLTRLQPGDSLKING